MVISLNAIQGCPATDAELNSWYSREEAARICACSERHLSRLLEAIDSDKKRNVVQGRGRPMVQIHYSAHPALLAHWRAGRIGHGAESIGQEAGSGPSPLAPACSLPMVGRAGRLSPSPARPAAGVTPAHLALARLRAQAVMQYESFKVRLPEKNAAAAVCQAWKLRPQSTFVEVDERLGRHVRGEQTLVRLGKFSASTLRGWCSTYIRSGRDLLSLAPNYCARGRARKEIALAYLDQAHALAVTSPRGCVTSALAAMPKPEASYSTILRRIRERDPAQAFDALGKRGVQHFRRQHSPDIERNYKELSWNALWQLDDITEDFYVHSSDPQNQLKRPFAYAIMRVATREWVCVVLSEERIVQTQVRSLLGMAMTDPRACIPDAIKFERGTIACDAELGKLLDDLGIDWGRTSMDRGVATPGNFADAALGHPEGKAVIEGNIRIHHNLQWKTPGSTGPDERDSKPAYLENLKAAAIAAKQRGDPLLLLDEDQWQVRVWKAFQAHNQKPHSALPEVYDPETGTSKHMTPEEYGAHLLKTRPGRLRRLDEQMLPLFFQKGMEVEVGKNGIRLNNHTYGRYDLGLQALAGTKVRAFAMKEFPAVAYVEQLGRMVERYVKPEYGLEGDAYDRKLAVEKQARSGHERMIMRAMAGIGTVKIETVKFMAPEPGAGDPRYMLPDFATPALLARATALAVGMRVHEELQTDLEKRFEVAEEVSRGGAEPRRGLKERMAEMQEEVGVLS